MKDDKKTKKQLADELRSLRLEIGLPAEEHKKKQQEILGLLEGSRAVLKYSKFEEAARTIFDSCRK